ncbi:1806_t:CDS:2, partial [Gigaspora rosea]
ETQDDFSYDRIKERRLYKSSLKQLSGDEARKCLANFEWTSSSLGVFELRARIRSGHTRQTTWRIDNPQVVWLTSPWPAIVDFAFPWALLHFITLTFGPSKTSLNVDNFWKTVDKKLHENEIELENVDYAKHALKDTNNEMQLIRAVTNNRTI